MSQSRIKQLESLILKYKKAYYSGATLISDLEYDSIENELRKLHPNSQILQIVGTESKGTVSHDPPMLSIDKAVDIDKVIKWANNYDVVWGYKVDGLSIKLVYINGQLFQGSTRGDGEKGENVTDSILNFSGIPFEIPEMNKIEVRGEAYIPISIFKKLGEGKSPRNLATGTINGKDATLVKKRKIHFMAWDLVLDKDMYYSNKIKLLQDWGFQTADQQLINPNKINEVYTNVLKDRDTYDFEMDGLVLKINDPKIQNKMGYTTHHPRWMIALKFPAKVDSTVINDIIWQVGRTGKITPVAEVQPVNLAGATITRATLHNSKFILDNDIAIGDTVFIIRSGDVIPKILGVAEKGENCVLIPFHCPVCNSILYDDKTNIWCKNKNCGESRFRKIQHFAQIIEIELLGPETLRKLWDEGLVKEPSDLYKLDITTLRNLIGVNGVKIYEQLLKRKVLPMHYFLASLGIHTLSMETAKLLAVHFKTFDNLKNASEDDIRKIKGLGPTIAKSIVEGLSDSLIYQPLLDAGVTVKDYTAKPTAQQPKIKKSPITGLKMYITGSIPGYTKEGLEQLVTQYGGLWKAMSKSLDLLVLGENAGWKKIEDAKSLGLKTMEYTEFLKLIGI